MPSKCWRDRLLSSTRGRVIALLRREPKTVNELADELALTDNAVRAHLAALERDALVEQVGARRSGGKPAFLYRLTSEAESLFPKSYAAVLSLLLDVLAERAGAGDVQDLLREVGHRAVPGGPAPHGDLRARVEAACDVLNRLGGEAEVLEQDGMYRIRGYACPLLDVTQDHPEMCKLGEALLSEVIGAPVVERCTRNERARCNFEVPRQA